MRELVYAQIPSGQTFLHLIRKNLTMVKEVFQIAKE